MDNQEQRYSEEEANSIIEFALRTQGQYTKDNLAKTLDDLNIDKSTQEEAFENGLKKNAPLEKRLSFNKKELLLLPLFAAMGANMGVILTTTYGGIYSLLTQSPFLPMLKSGVKYGVLFGVGTFLLKEGMDIYERYNKKED
jgi:hypothetical protein